MDGENFMEKPPQKIHGFGGVKTPYFRKHPYTLPETNSFAAEHGWLED